MEDAPAPRRVTVQARRQEDLLRVEFSDTGPGIAPEHLSKVFDPFFTTKAVGRGTGLGLSLAYGVVREHGGTIEARNHPGGGACISLTLPVATDPRDRPAVPAPSVAPGGDDVTGRRILIVDDEELLATVMREALETEGYRVEVALDGAAALDRLRQAEYDLVITDVKMPNMNGRDLHREILRSAPALEGRILFSTGDVVNPATREFFAQTRSPHITKPFNLSELRRLVRALLRTPGVGA
jgi:two-component system NtrC family sensor kinase